MKSLQIISITPNNTSQLKYLTLTQNEFELILKLNNLEIGSLRSFQNLWDMIVIIMLLIAITNICLYIYVSEMYTD